MYVANTSAKKNNNTINCKKLNPSVIFCPLQCYMVAVGMQRSGGEKHAGASELLLHRHEKKRGKKKGTNVMNKRKQKQNKTKIY